MSERMPVWASAALGAAGVAIVALLLDRRRTATPSAAAGAAVQGPGSASDPAAPALPVELTAPEVPVVEASAAEVPEAPSRRPLILVADDDDDIRALVSYRLVKAGFEVVTARDGEEALAVATEQEPSLCVLDVMMPKRTGVEVTEELRANERTRAIPVILLTARVQEADVARGFEAGADDYLRKPFSPQELGARVQAILGRAA